MVEIDHPFGHLKQLADAYRAEAKVNTQSGSSVEAGYVALQVIFLNDGQFDRSFRKGDTRFLESNLLEFRKGEWL